jgi:hypothetical protein
MQAWSISWFYNLRHTFCRPPHCSWGIGSFRRSDDRPFHTRILQKYSKAIDEYRREAVRKREQLRDVSSIQQNASMQTVN